MTSSIEIHKLDPQGQELVRYEGEIVERTEEYTLVRAVYDHQDRELFGLSLRAGDVFLEYHLPGRWYNLFAVLTEDQSSIKGWYCNITRPPRMDQRTIYAVDLALDIVVDAEGVVQLLDEEEFEAIQLPEGERQLALRAAQEVQQMAREGAGPFSDVQRFIAGG